MSVRIFVKAFSSITRIRPIYAMIAGVAVLALVVGGIIITNMRKTIDLSIDGQSRELTTYAASVSDLLDDEGIEVGEHDLVAPGMEADLEDGQSVVVRYAQQLNLEIDGEERDRKSTRLNSSHVANSYAVFCLKTEHIRNRTLSRHDT